MCFSNRSAASLKLADATAALADAEQCVELNPKWAKGYSRQAAALQALKRWDEAASACETGLEAVGSDDSLRKMLEEVRNRQFQDQLQGTWHGAVTAMLGGYDQQMEFLSESNVRVEVVGRSIVGKYWVNCKEHPYHLDIQVPVQDVPLGMPMPPPVPYIAKLDDDGLHLCCPVMSMERPTSFDGHGYCLMTSGPLAVGNDDVAHLSDDEKRLHCARELIEALPDRKMEEVTNNDSEDTVRDKLMAQVKFESSMFAVQKRYGDEVLREVLGATKDGDVPPSLKGSNELVELTEKLKKCGIPDESPASFVNATATPSVADSTKAVQSSRSQSSVSAALKLASCPDDPPAASEAFPSALTLGLILSGATALVVLGVALWRKQRR